MKKTLLAVILLSAAASYAAPPARYVCDVANDHTNFTYHVGEDAVFTVTVADTNGVKAAGKVMAKLDNFGPQKIFSRMVDLSTENPFSVTGRLDKAGFLRLTVHGKDVATRVWSVAYDPTLIRPATERPADFMEYWKGEKARLAREVPLDAKVTPLPEMSKDKWDVSAISFATFCGRRVYGFMSVPKDKSKAPFQVRFNVPGAGPGARTVGRAAGVVHVLMNVHRYDPLSGDVKELYAAQNKELSRIWNVPGYATSGVSEKREDYFFHDVILGIDRVVDWVAEQPYVDKSRIRYYGSSQGGGFGLILAGLNGKISRLAVHVPAITDLLGRLAGRQSGWPQVYESQRSDAARQAALRNMPYFDASHFASYITCPVRMTVGYSDTCCAPPAVYSSFNAIPSKDKKMFDCYGMGHKVSPVYNPIMGRWLNER